MLGTFKFFNLAPDPLVNGTSVGARSEKNTSGDAGLQTFTVSGAQAVLVDSLNFCGGQQTCFHGINCATGYTHSVTIDIRRGNAWKKSFSVDATEPVFLSVEPYVENPKFRALVLSVHAGDLGCPVRDKVIRRLGRRRSATSS